MTTLDELFKKPATVPKPPQSSNPFAALKQSVNKTVSATPNLQPSITPTPEAAVEATLSSEFNFGNQPENLSEQATNELHVLFGQLQESLGGDKISDNLNRILTHLHNHPFLRDVLQPDDIHLIAKSVQASNGITIQKKTERKAKRSANQDEVDNMANTLGNMGFVGPGG